MSTFCIQCALEAFVAGKSSHTIQLHAVFDETPLQHLKRVHPDPVQTERRRVELNKQAAALLGGGFVDPYHAS